MTSSTTRQNEPCAVQSIAVQCFLDTSSPLINIIIIVSLISNKSTLQALVAQTLPAVKEQEMAAVNGPQGLRTGRTYGKRLLAARASVRRRRDS